MRITRSIVAEGMVLLGVLAVISWFFLLSGRVFHTHTSNAQNRDALVQLHGAIEIGASASEVRDLYQRYATPQLRLHDERATDWVVRMPIEFGASDWKLLLDFRDDKVVRVRLLTADGPPPENGPPDKTEIRCLTSGLERTRDGTSCLDFNVRGPAPLRPSVSYSESRYEPRGSDSG